MKSLDKSILNILLPLTMENALVLFSSMILTGYIGHLKIVEINAYGLNTRIYSIYYSLAKGLCIGAMIIMAKAYGQQRNDLLCRHFRCCYYLLAPLCLMAMTTIFLFREVIFRMMSTNSSLIQLGCQYLIYVLPSYLFMAFSAIHTAVFQAMGDTKTPMWIAVIGNLCNVSIGYVLIFGIGNFTGFGMYGAAITMVFSSIVMFGVGLYLLLQRNHILVMYDKQKNHISFQEIWQLFALGLPTSLQNSIWQFATLFISKIILSFGDAYYAAYQIGLQGETFSEVLSSGFMTASMTLGAIAIGKQDLSGYKETYTRLKQYAFWISILAMIYLQFFTGITVKAFTDKPVLQTIAIGYLYIMVFSQIPQNIQRVMSGYMMANGYTKWPLGINVFGIVIVRIGLCMIIAYVLHESITGIWWAFNIDIYMRYLVSFGILRHYHILDRFEKERVCA